MVESEAILSSSKWIIICQGIVYLVADPKIKEYLSLVYKFVLCIIFKLFSDPSKVEVGIELGAD